MILNEEQRNYIKILREIIEKNLFENGYAPLIKKSREYKNYVFHKGLNENDENNITDFFVDFSKFKLENERFKNEVNLFKKELEDNKILINDLKLKNENLNVNNLNLKEENEKKNEFINNLNLDNQNLKKEINDLNYKINNLISQNEELNNHLNDYKNLNKEKEIKIEENLKLIVELKKELENKKNEEEKLFLLKEEIEKTKINLKEERNLKDDLEKQLIETKIENENLNQTLKNLGNNKDDLSYTLKNIKDKFNITLNYQNEIEQLTSCIQIREKELKETILDYNKLNNNYLKLQNENCLIQNKLNKILETNKSLNECNDNLKEEINKYKKRNLFNFNNKNCCLENNNCDDINQLKCTIEKLNKKLYDIEIEYQQLFNEYNNLKNGTFNNFEDNNNNNINIKDKNNQLEIFINKLKEENKNLCIEKNDLENKLNEFLNKEKYDKHFFQDDINNLIVDLEKINEQYNMKNNNIIKFKSALSSKDFFKISINEILTLTNENCKLKKDLNLFNQKIPEIEKEKEIYLNNKKDLNLKVNNLNCIIERLNNEKKNMKKEINDYKQMNNQLKITIQNYSNELNSKNNMITNSNYDNNLYKDKNAKLIKDNNYLISIINKLSKFFPGSNICFLINQFINSISCDEKERLNENLMIEVTKIEDYINDLKCNNNNNYNFNDISTNNNSFNDSNNSNYNNSFKIANYKSTLKY